MGKNFRNHNFDKCRQNCYLPDGRIGDCFRLIDSERRKIKIRQSADDVAGDDKSRILGLCDIIVTFWWIVNLIVFLKVFSVNVKYLQTIFHCFIKIEVHENIEIINGSR